MVKPSGEIKEHFIYRINLFHQIDILLFFRTSMIKSLFTRREELIFWKGDYNLFNATAMQHATYCKGFIIVIPQIWKLC